MHAHCMGASGALELIACVMAVREGIVPPTANYREKDPECDLDVTPNVARKRDVRAAISNAFAFGGTNAVDRRHQSLTPRGHALKADPPRFSRPVLMRRRPTRLSAERPHTNRSPQNIPRSPHGRPFRLSDRHTLAGQPTRTASSSIRSRRRTA